MVTFVIIAFVVIVLTAIMNWKMSMERARKFTKPIVIIWNVYFIFMFVFTCENHMDFSICFHEDIIDSVLFILIAVLINHILFITTIYIPYTKNKTNIESIKKVIKEAFIFNICMISVLIMFIYMIFYSLP